MILFYCANNIAKNVLSSYGYERVINEIKPKMGQIKEKAKCKFLRPKGFEKSQIRGIWPQKSQSGNPGSYNDRDTTGMSTL